jgi:FKBP-type peptidyl-prolyl cis-trans isomerase (trigger factor)
MATLSPSLDKFVEELLAAKGVDNLDEAVRLQLTEDLTGRLNDRLEGALVAELAEEKLPALEELLDQEATDEELQRFFADNIKDLPAVLTRELAAFRQAYLG